MRKKGRYTILALFLSLLLSGAALAGGMYKGEESKKEAAAPAGEYVGLAVTDREGVSIGTVSALRTDEEGSIRFAIVGVGEKEYFVPFSAFEPTEQGNALTLTVDENLLVNAPAQLPDMTAEEYSRELYEHYGQAPHWGPGAAEAIEEK